MLRLEGLTKKFGDTTAVDGLSLEVGPGEFLTLLGPSGCGKTTTLRLVAGFERPDAGRIELNGRDVTRLPAERRGIGMVFQNYALFPHLDVFENVAFGLRTRRLTRSEIRRRVGEALELVDLAGFEARRVQDLSGGQQQRVALARALAPEPPVLLLDEPLSNLDAALREKTRAELRALLERQGITAIFVTHDQEEAFALSDRIAILEAGRLRQVGTPEALYYQPASPFVAAFLGRANFLPGQVIAVEGDTILCELADGVRWRAKLPAAGKPSGNGMSGGAAARLMVRPESLRLGPCIERTPPDLAGTVLERRFAGAVTQYRVRAGGAELLVHGGPADARRGEEVVVRLAEGTVPLAFPDPD